MAPVFKQENRCHFIAPAVRHFAKMMNISIFESRGLAVLFTVFKLLCRRAAGLHVHQLCAWVIVGEYFGVCGAVLGHDVGAVLAHAHAVAVTSHGE